ncbi:MAG: hypothetical protein ACXVDF_24975, partial [Ktedonobacterales bacterium]
MIETNERIVNSMTSHAKHAKDPKAAPLTAQERHDKASALAFANIHKHGVEPLRNQLRRGFEHRFENQIDALDPGLRERNPAEYDRRVAGALRDHMLELTRR